MKNAEAAFNKTESKYQRFLKSMPFGWAYHRIIIDKDNKPIDYVFLDANEDFEKLTGLKKEDFIGKKVTEVLPGIRKNEIDWINVYSKIAINNNTAKFESFSSVLNKWYSVSAFRPENRHFVTLFEDITHHKQAEEKITRIKEEWEKTFDTVPDIIFVTDNHCKIVKANRALISKLGDSGKDLIGKTCYQVIHRRNEPPSYCPHKKVLLENTEHFSEIYEKNFNKHFLLSFSPIIDSEGNSQGIIHVYRDISARKEMEKKLENVSITDELTGLFNRRGFLTLAEKGIKLANRQRRRISLLYLDLNNMKVINDKFGHSTGDIALVDTANILKKSLRDSDILGRIGGDEFAILITDISDSDINNVIMQHINNNLKIHNEQSGYNYRLSLSIGIAHYNPDNPFSLKELMGEADSSMYEDKKRYKQKEVLLPFKVTERREYKRFTISNSYRADIDREGKFEIKDISFGGICLKTQDELIANSSHEIIFYEPENHSISITAIVAWSTLKEKTVQRSGNETGFKFKYMSDEFKNSIDKVISKQ